MFRRSFVLFLSTFFLLAFSTASFAQETALYCEALEASDCDLLDASVEAMSNISSAATEVQISILLQDIPEMPVNELFLQYDQSSAFMMNEEVQALITQLQSMSPAQMEKMGDDPAFALSLLRTIIDGMPFGLDMRLQMSEELAALLSEEVRADLGMDLPTDISLRLMNVDGILYLDTTTIAPFVPQMALFANGWVGVEAAPLLDLAEAELGTASAGDMAAMSLGGGATGGVTFGMAGPVVTTVDVVDPSGEALKFMDIERVESEEGADDVATFVTTINYADFFQSPIFRNLVYMIATEQGQEMSAEELDETVSLAQIMGPSLLQGLELFLIEEVGIEDSYLYYSDLVLEWDLASLLTLAAAGDPSMQMAEDAAPFAGLELISSSNQLNEEIDLAAPEGAFVIPTAMLMQFAGQ